MNEKITLPTLISLLAERSGKSKKLSEDFVKEFFNTIVSSLEEGDSVRIKGLGTFKVLTVMERKSVNVNTGEEIEIPRHSKISFIPAKELADEVNAPFSIFESVEIPDDSVDPSDPATPIDPAVPVASVDSVAPEASAEPEAPVGPADPVAPIESVSEFVGEDITADDYSYNEPCEETEGDPQEEPEGELGEEPQKKSKSFKFLYGFIAGIAAALILCVGAYFYARYAGIDLMPNNNGKNQETVAKSTSVAAPDIVYEVKDTIEEAKAPAMAQAAAEKSIAVDEEIAPTKPSDEPIYDTISKTRYLTTMAKDHYGNYNLWPYIYEENKAILGHPDRIRPGTRIVIPSLSKYGVDPNNPEDISKAKRKGVEIYARYQ